MAATLEKHPSSSEHQGSPPQPTTAQGANNTLTESYLLCLTVCYCWSVLRPYEILFLHLQVSGVTLPLTLGYSEDLRDLAGNNEGQP